MAALTGDYLDHKTTSGDRWDLLAYRYYGDARRQTTLIEANRALFLTTLAIPLVLPAGMLLRVPVIEQPSNNEASLPPWKRQGASYGSAT